MFEDKENARPVSYNVPSKPLVAASKFGRLLNEATREITMQQDEKLAMNSQINEASEMAASWIREEKDHQMAAKLVRELEQEDKAAMAKEVAIGERTALSIAMEERRQVLAEAKSMKEREEKDGDFAKKVVLDDVEERAQLMEMCKGDGEVAARVQALLHDEMLADEIQRAEVEADRRVREQRENIERADAELAAKEQELLEKELEMEAARQEERDAESARAMQALLDDKEKINLQRQKLADAVVAQNMQIKSLRQEHRQHRRAELISSGRLFVSTDHAALLRQWEDADADCEDVAGGICLTLLLPNLRDLKVGVIGKNTIEIDAFRQLTPNEKVGCKASQFSGEFVISGRRVSITEKDISFEYNSETGLLFVYVEKVQLQGDGPSSPGSSSPRTSGKEIMGALKASLAGFTRIFRGSASSKK